MSEENVEIVRRFIEAANGRDDDASLGSPHPDIEFRTSGLYRGEAQLTERGKR